MEYMTGIKMNNLKGSSREYMDKHYPRMIKDLETESMGLRELEKKELLNLSEKQKDSDYFFFVTEKWAFFQMGLDIIKARRVKVLEYKAELEKDLNSQEKKKSNIMEMV